MVKVDLQGYGLFYVKVSIYSQLQNEYWAFCRYYGCTVNDVGFKTFLAGYVVSKGEV
jgi:hypothetical protein